MKKKYNLGARLKVNFHPLGQLTRDFATVNFWSTHSYKPGVTRKQTSNKYGTPWLSGAKTKTYGMVLYTYVVLKHRSFLLKHYYFLRDTHYVVCQLHLVLYELCDVMHQLHYVLCKLYYMMCKLFI